MAILKISNGTGDWYVVEAKDPGALRIDEVQTLTEGQINNIKQTLDAAGIGEVDLTDYVKNTDYASASVGGVVKVQQSDYGLFINGNGLLSVMKPTTQQIDAKIDDYKPIVPSVLDYAVMKALTDAKNHTWTEAEQLAARDRLGVTAIVGDIETALNSIITMQESVVGGGSV